MSEPTDPTRLARETLAAAGVSTPYWRVVTGKSVVLLIILVAVVGYAWLLLEGQAADKPSPWPSILATAGAALAAALAYVQWHLGREEASFDKYYDRMRLVNEHIDAAGREYARLEALTPPQPLHSTLLDHHRNMIVFTELDSLEYVLGKRRLNYVEDDLVERAVRTFKARCAQPWFVEKVRYWTDKAEMGYRPRTRAAARHLAGLPK